MNWQRTENRQWSSDCGKYRINAMPDAKGFIYAAVYVRGLNIFDGLGMFIGEDSNHNAQQARQACETHQREQC